MFINAVVKPLQSDDDAGVVSQYTAYYVAAITVFVCGFVMVIVLSLLIFSIYYRQVRSSFSIRMDSEASKQLQSDSKCSVS
jgi:hypothetical protein